MKKSLAMCILHWSLGIVVLIEAALFGFSHCVGRTFAHTGMPDWIRTMIAGVEIIAAVLFLIPPTMIAGSWILVGVTLFAIVPHLLHGMFAVGSLVVFAAAALAVGADRSK